LPPLEKLVIPGTPSNGAPLAEPTIPPAEATNLLGQGEPEPSESPLAHALDRKGDDASEVVEVASGEPPPESALSQEELRLEESDGGSDPR